MHPCLLCQCEARFSNDLFLPAIIASGLNLLNFSERALGRCPDFTHCIQELISYLIEIAFHAGLPSGTDEGNEPETTLSGQAAPIARPMTFLLNEFYLSKIYAYFKIITSRLD